MTADVQTLFRNAELTTDDQVYTLVKLPPSAVMAAAGVLADLRLPFSAVIVDEHEVSLILPLEAMTDYESRLPEAHQEGQFRLITFNTVLALDIIGFMAVVSRILADVDISIMPYAAFSRDHILVPEPAFQRAWDALKKAQQTQ